MGMSKKSLKYILVFLGAIIILAAYFLVFLNYSDKTEALDNEIATLQNRLTILRGYSADMEENEKAIETVKVSINETLSKYYSVELPEDFIMFATALENNQKMNVNSMSFAEPTPIYGITAVADLDYYNVPLETIPLMSYKISSGINGVMTYDQLKNTLEYIYSQKDVTTLDTLNITYDSSTGLILGNFVINKFYITGRDIEDHQVYVPYSDIGNDVLMGG